MTRSNASPRILPSTAALKPMLSKSLICVCLSMGLVACATAPATSTSKSSATAQPTPEFSSASKELKTRNYKEAVKQFDEIIEDGQTPSNERRLAYIGMALVYLSYDENWRSLKNARASLASAAKVPVPQGESLDHQTDMLMEAVVALIDSQAAYETIESQSGDTGYQITQLKKKNQALETELTALQKENKNLNEALEKLKKLTLDD